MLLKLLRKLKNNLRPSGTEALIRVMIDGLDQDDIDKKAKKIADVIEKKFGV